MIIYFGKEGDTLDSLPIFRRQSSNETGMTAAITSDLNNSIS